MFNPKQVANAFNLDEMATPAYYICTQTVKENFRKVKLICDKHDLLPFFSFKAFPTILDMPLLESEQARINFDVANHAELSYLLEKLSPAELAGRAISITGPLINNHRAFKQVLELMSACTADCYINVESVQIIEDLAQEIAQHPHVKVGVRIAWDDLADQKVPSRFGAPLPSPAQFEQLLKWGLKGFHFHSPSTKDRHSYIRLVEKLMATYGDMLGQLEYMNFGGSIPGGSLAELEAILIAMREIAPQSIKIHIEPGALFFGGAILFCSRVCGTQFFADRPMHVITLDSSRECHLKWTNPCIVAPENASAQEEQAPTLFGGAACFELDVFKVCYWPKQHLPKPGDLIFFESVSVYSIAWNTSFNGIKTAEINYVTPRDGDKPE
jgi:diaminopimelate decarboxylase